MRTLQEVAKNGRCVLFSVHQPRFKIFERFDVLLLLAEGRLAYNGPAKVSGVVWCWVLRGCMLCAVRMGGRRDGLTDDHRNASATLKGTDSTANHSTIQPTSFSI